MSFHYNTATSCSSAGFIFAQLQSVVESHKVSTTFVKRKPYKEEQLTGCNVMYFYTSYKKVEHLKTSTYSINQCWLVCSYFLCWLKEGGTEIYGWGKRGEQTKPTTTTKRPPRIWEAAKPTSGENIMGFVQYMWNIFCPCDVTSVTSDANLNCPFSTCAICYPRGCHPEAYIFQVLVNEKQCLPPPETPSLRIM